GYLSSDGYDLRKDPFKALSSYQRQKVRTQYHYVDEILSGVPKRIYRVRSRKKMLQVLRSQGITNVPRNLKVAFLPATKEKTTIKSIKPKKITGIDAVTGKTIELVTLSPFETITRDVRRRYLFIKPEFLLDAPLDAIREAMGLADADLYSIQAGIHEITSGPYKLLPNDKDKDIKQIIDKLIKKYSEAGANNNWKNWLGGLVAYYYPEQSDYDIYRNESDQAKMKLAAERKRERTLSKRRNQKELIQEKQEKAIEKALIKERKTQAKRISKEIKILRKEIAEFIAEGVVTKRDKKILRREKKRLDHLVDIRTKLK
ncbi:MAG: hypothetical protein ABW166_19380, partial [Sedimenticola sp.]